MRYSKKYINALTYKVIGCAIEVHRQLGPGLLEIMYERALCHEMQIQQIPFERQKKIELKYKGVSLNALLQFDVLVEGVVLIELKAVTQMHPIFEAQLITYMQQCAVPKGILLNFHVVNLYKEGTKTFVNKHYQNLPDE
ncbi:MAG: GxxExxY protein [Saprospiraceae bacterium]|nr:GxxExxY protein [Saprospiraceae bacterium]